MRFFLSLPISDMAAKLKADYNVESRINFLNWLCFLDRKLLAS